VYMQEALEKRSKGVTFISMKVVDVILEELDGTR